MGTQPSSQRFRIAATPSRLYAFATASDSFAHRVRSAQFRCWSNAYVDCSGLRSLSLRADEFGASVRDVGQRLDAADLAGRLHSYSSLVRVSMRSRAVLNRSMQTTLIGQATERRFLRVDTSGNGRVVEVIGDLRRAKHVAVVVPGMTNALRDYDEHTRQKAADLSEAMRALDPDVAVIAWLGYRTPNATLAGLGEAAASGRARQGAIDLVDDLEVIRRMAPTSHLSLIGHSYGSVVAGEAMRMKQLRVRVEALNIDDVAVVGSPGMNASSRRDLGHPDIDLWAAKTPSVPVVTVNVSKDPRRWANLASQLPIPMPIRIGPLHAPVEVRVQPRLPSDLVPYAPVHGEDPSARGFGSRRFSTKGAVSHSTYFVPGSVSLENLARIATNQAVVKEPTKPTTKPETKPTTKPETKPAAPSDLAHADQADEGTAEKGRSRP